MHIPPLHKKKSWQRVFVGALFGGVIAYCTFIFMYGTMYERLLEENYTLQSQVTELKSQNEALLQDKKSIDEKANEPVTVDTVEIIITNEKALRFDRLITHQLEELIKQEINHIIGQDINVVSESDQLLIATIENKAFKIDDFTYYFEIQKLTISQKVKLTVKAKVSN